MRKLHLSFIVSYPDGDRQIDLVGQYARTMRELIDAGDKGITSGKGWHGRYVLHTRARLLLDQEAG